MIANPEDAGLTGVLLIDVSIGVIFAMLAFSLLATAVHEAIAGVLNLRGAFLRRGIAGLVRDPELCAALLSHPLVAPAAPGRGRMPASIPADAFARALVEALALRRDELAAEIDGARDARAEALATVDREIAALAVDHRLKARLRDVARRVDLGAAEPEAGAAEALREAEAAIARRFDAAMERVSGWYARRTQAALFAIGAAAAAAVNFDVLGYAAQLARDDAMRSAIVARAAGAAETGAVGSLRLEGMEMPAPAAALAPAARGAAVPPAPVPRPGTLAVAGAGTGAGAVTGAAAGAAPAPLPEADAAGAALAAMAGRARDGLSSLRAGIGGPGAPGAALGWDSRPAGPAELLRMAAGWMLVGLACTLGGQFWFDLLRSAFRLRAGGGAGGGASGGRAGAAAPAAHGA